MAGVAISAKADRLAVTATVQSCAIINDNYSHLKNNGVTL
jgi:hypothetical protein